MLESRTDFLPVSSILIAIKCFKTFCYCCLLSHWDLCLSFAALLSRRIENQVLARKPNGRRTMTKRCRSISHSFWMWFLLCSRLSLDTIPSPKRNCGGRFIVARLSSASDKEGGRNAVLTQILIKNLIPEHYSMTLAGGASAWFYFISFDGSRKRENFVSVKRN